jgi:REP element-mobilizing transposase RayT
MRSRSPACSRERVIWCGSQAGLLSPSSCLPPPVSRRETGFVSTLQRVVHIGNMRTASRYGVEHMPHAPRTWPSSNLHLITTAGNGRCKLFLDIADRELFLDLLDEVVEKYTWELFAWCLLGNHLHFVVRAEREPLYLGMQRLKSIYAVRFHRRHHTRGHLFKRPYDSRPILTVEQLHRSCGYVLRNATRHGFVDRTEEWEWSSFRTVARLVPPPRRHLGCEPFDRLMQLSDGTERLAIMRAYVRETAGESAMIVA